MKAQKYNSLKVDFRSLDPAFLAEMAKIFDYGRIKYAAFNFANKGLTSADFYSAIMRHLLLIGSGELNDTESRCGHLAHIACCALMWYTNLNIKNIDNSPVFLPVDIAKVKAALQKDSNILRKLARLNKKKFNKNNS